MDGSLGSGKGGRLNAHSPRGQAAGLRWIRFSAKFQPTFATPTDGLWSPQLARRHCHRGKQPGKKDWLTSARHPSCVSSESAASPPIDFNYAHGSERWESYRASRPNARPRRFHRRPV